MSCFWILGLKDASFYPNEVFQENSGNPDSNLFVLNLHTYVNHLQKVVNEVMDMTFPRRGKSKNARSQKSTAEILGIPYLMAR